MTTTEIQTNPCEYVTNHDGTFKRTLISNQKPVLAKIANFSAWITLEKCHNDGLNQTKWLTLEGEHKGVRLPAIEISHDEFLAMSWPLKQWGSFCIIESGYNNKDKMRHAILVLSEYANKTKQLMVFTHLGWQRVAGHQAYLTNLAVIGNLPKPISVLLPEFKQFALPAPSKQSEQCLQAAKASLSLLNIAPYEVTIPLLAATFLAPLQSTLKSDFALWLVGPSRSQKSTLAALFAAHFGKHITRTNLPANCFDTPAALEYALFTLADTLVVIDDFAPQPNAKAQTELDATITRIIRTLDNRSARHRMTQQLTQRPTMQPRGLTLFTAEQWPKGESITARCFGIPLEPHQVDLSQLSNAQHVAHNGLLAQSMANYIDDIAQNYKQHLTDIRSLWKQYRQHALEAGLDGRLPEQVAYLAVGFSAALKHAVNLGALTQEKSNELNTQGIDVLTQLAKQHRQHIATAQPADHFKLAFADLLANGSMHLRCKNSDHFPPNGHLYGWLHDRPQGEHIGWVDNEHFYLLSTPTLKVINENMYRGGCKVNLQPQSLWQQCRLRGWLIPGNADGNFARNSIKIRVNQQQHRVLCFNINALRQP